MRGWTGLDPTGNILEFFLVAMASIIAIMNPASTAAVYAVLTNGMTEKEKAKVAHQSMKIGALVLLFFAITGQLVFAIFGFDIPAFRIAGGILLITVALGMLFPKNNEFKDKDMENISIVPLAFPMTCGPGTITTVILLAAEATNVFQTLIVFIAIFIGVFLSYVGMKYSPQIFNVIGEEGFKVIPKLMAIIVLAIAVQFIINGIIEVMPQILHIPG
ncbi:MarC family protein [Methanocella sp. CWC-04]|uniref:UPF0056 membrane protein n=1 Tax=Methanooceanicella nereidis TaxID=2052831 RepID=A0AAP2REJ1_9EURY|nr:MarC family protein [Methanocella sp. CWC-04]MCD1296254.1 MarC family protein [Methanocella sp. CWC-04]